MSYINTAEQERKLDKQFKDEHTKMMKDANIYISTVFFFLSIFAFSFSVIALSKFYSFAFTLITSSVIGGLMLFTLMTALKITQKNNQRTYVNECKTELKNRD